ncbi:hypothetical protein CDES_00915 [Corynebacterium deserti GIMN1.010]|uniref:Methylated-DNA-[protein]-cysteine S-methyltransferase DNA binding domain-containing protein n=1 Tax=Corynebacterium deserti GIMN1.010 TaxID=931089 RepID=A0A0M3Q8Y5_9CORY|nr:MGMT family protein [Corynebacterium deserti]ALC04663.1 hypothetical protein CDES_00915 [Corynebacterium deserti GIMN1.010]
MEDGILEFDDLTSLVLDLVDQIPAGTVTTYGDIGKVVSTGPRQIGRIMATSGQFTAWWRVVRADGGSQVASTARTHWDAEGIAYSGETPKVVLRKHRVGIAELQELVEKLSRA